MWELSMEGKNAYFERGNEEKMRQINRKGNEMCVVDDGEMKERAWKMREKSEGVTREMGNNEGVGEENGAVKGSL